MLYLELPGIPGGIFLLNEAVDFRVEAAGDLVVVAGEKTDWFADPGQGGLVDNAPAALFTPPDPEFLLSARVNVDFASAFDAGVLQLRVDDNRWAKLCFEYSPQGKPMVVSVVTRGISDDCNSCEIPRDEVFLRVAKTPRHLAFHFSTDGLYWNLVRYFSLGDLDGLRAGFSCQSPTGGGCRALFSGIRYRSGALRDLRNGE
jgi:uncharacterized protein